MIVAARKRNEKIVNENGAKTKNQEVPAA